MNKIFTILNGLLKNQLTFNFRKKETYGHN